MDERLKRFKDCDHRLYPYIYKVLERLSEEVKEHVALLGEKLKTLGKPKVANVVSTDIDFGMIRMFEIYAEGVLQHEFHVFRSLEEACEWLGIETSDTG